MGKNYGQGYSTEPSDGSDSVNSWDILREDANDVEASGSAPNITTSQDAIPAVINPLLESPIAPRPPEAEFLESQLPPESPEIRSLGQLGLSAFDPAEPIPSLPDDLETLTADLPNPSFDSEFPNLPDFPLAPEDDIDPNSPDLDDDYEEDPEFELSMQRWGQWKVIEPIFQSEIKRLLDNSNEYDIRDDRCKNFLIDGELLPQLAEVAKDEDLAGSMEFTLEKTIEKWALENDISFGEDEDLYDVCNQLLAITLQRAAKDFAKEKITKEQLNISCQVLTALGLPIPLEANNIIAKEFFEGTSAENYQTQEVLRNAGIIDDKFIQDSHQLILQRSFENADLPMPDYLANPSEEMLQYWNDLSAKLKIDAFATFALTVQVATTRSKFSGEPVISPAIYFDEQGKPAPIAFSDQSPLIDSVFGNFPTYGIDEDSAVVFIKEFSDQLSHTDAFFLDAIINATNTDEKSSLRSELRALRANLGYNNVQIIGDDGQPTQNFWDFVDKSPDMRTISLFPDYEEHCSESRIAATKLPRHIRNHLRAYIDDALLNDPNYVESYVDDILEPNGTLSPYFYLRNIIGVPVAENLAADFPEDFELNFDEVEQSYLKLPKSYRDILHDQADSNSLFLPDMISDYVAADGPKDQLFQLAFQSGNFKILLDQPLRDKMHLPFSESQFYALEQFHQIRLSDNSNAQRVNFDVENLSMADEYAHAISLVDVNELTHEQIDAVVGIVRRVATSNAVELRRAGKNFLQDIIRSDDPDLALSQIEQVFLHNNLPYAGKVFRTFQVLHPANRAYDEEFADASVIEDGVLKDLPNTGLISRESVLMTDVIKASICSNNRAMRDYIKNLRAGQELANQLLDSDMSYEDLSETDQQILKTFTDHLETLYSQTSKGRRDTNFTRSGNIKQDLQLFTDAFGVTERHNLSDRVVRSFCYLLGVKSLAELESYMDNTVATADARNRERYESNDFSLKANDLVKAVDMNYIDNILQNGSVCKEFLNGEAESDATPLDTDVTELGAECTGDISQSIDWKNANASFSSTTVNLVIKDSSLIQRDGEKYDPAKLELLNNWGSNCGIRTAFPSSAIDFIVFDSDADDHAGTPENRNRLFSEIVKNGFYIPVVDKTTGKCIFSPDEYDFMRQKLSGLEHYGTPEFAFAEDADLYTPGIESLLDAVIEQDKRNTKQRSIIETRLGEILARNFPDFQGLKTQPDGDLTPGYVELIDTGSTGRGTSIPGTKADFDFVMRIDASTYLKYSKMGVFEDTLRQSLQAAEDHSNMNGLRLKGISFQGIDEPVDLDVSFMQRTNHMEFSTDQAIRERLQAIQTQSPERYPAVVANIVLAKQILKNAGAYKPQHSADTLDHTQKGGLGGVGIEKWILQNGGSLKLAAESFLATVDDVDGDFTRFCETYPIWDAGQNHFAVRDSESSTYTSHKAFYDNFVTRNMSQEGFRNMTTTLRNYLDSIAKS